MQDCYHCEQPCDIEYGYCHCGCGQEVPRINNHRQDLLNGQPWKYLTGHQRKRALDPKNEDLRRELLAKRDAFTNDGTCPYCEQGCEVGGGYCHCGCGRKANLKQETAVTRGYVKGMPSQYLKGHSHGTVLSDEEVRKMRYLYATKDVTQEELAEMFNANKKQVGSALRYETYVEAGIATGPTDT